MNVLQQNSDKLLTFVAEKFENKQIDNSTLVQLIELCGSYLNLQTIPKYCKNNNISYNGAKKCRNIIKVLGVKFVQEND
jgi:hypothetical protein